MRCCWSAAPSCTRARSQDLLEGSRDARPLPLKAFASPGRRRASYQRAVIPGAGEARDQECITETGPSRNWILGSTLKRRRRLNALMRRAPELTARAGHTYFRDCICQTARAFCAAHHACILRCGRRASHRPRKSLGAGRRLHFLSSPPRERRAPFGASVAMAPLEVPPTLS